MASGSNPFEARTTEATSARILGVEPAALSEVSSCGPQLDRIVAACLCKGRLDRYKSTQLLVTDLERLQAGTSSGRAPSEKSRRQEAADTSSGSRTLTPRWWWEFHQ